MAGIRSVRRDVGVLVSWCCRTECRTQCSEGVALIDGERLRAEVARADDRAASLVLNGLSSRVISLATGIVMHQRLLSEDEAERVLRQAARDSGRAAAEVAADILGSGALAEAAGAPVRLSAGARDRDLPAGVRRIGTAQAARQLISLARWRRHAPRPRPRVS
jgi:ANTAR domain